MDLRTALGNIHRDPDWWRKVLTGGALTLTVFGAPWSAGLAVESLENVRRGYPSPLPPSVDFGGRYVIGLFALIIDFLFFAIPLFVLGMLFICGIGSMAFSQSGQVSPLISGGAAAVIALFLLAVFASSIAPAGRLIYSAEGDIEQALSMATVRRAFDPQLRGAYARARLRSLVGYIPFTLFLAILWLTSGLVFPGSWLLTLILLWLACSALTYAHLVVAQLYGDAERASW
ncbi:DUF4013 domain-containing protein [Chloroflexia bacterium SDU3-3]|nr:DUF4013 domain-containing protein [Chloroflexia bacterium SDU3-3]